MTKQQKTARFIPAEEWLSQQRRGFIPADEWLSDYSVPEPQSHNHDIAKPLETEEVELNSEHLESDSEHINKIEEAVILHHEGIKAFLQKYNDVQIIQAFHFQATDRFLIFCKDLKVKKKRKEEYCLYWWDWANRITTKTADYVDCYFKYRELINLLGNPSPITLPEPPDLTEYKRNVTYCAADGKRCEQFTLALGV